MMSLARVCLYGGLVGLAVFGPAVYFFRRGEFLLSVVCVATASCALMAIAICKTKRLGKRVDRACVWFCFLSGAAAVIAVIARLLS
jgi:hypothetical protein